MIWVLLIITIIGLDQVTKHLSPVGSDIEIIKGFFYITYCENRGAAFSILQNFRWGFIVITVIAVAAMIWVMISQKHVLARLSLSLLIGGALGNMIDRLFMGYVVDFLNFYPFGYDFAIFNVADISITIGVTLLIIYILFIYKEPSERKTPVAEEAEADFPGSED